MHCDPTGGGIPTGIAQERTPRDGLDRGSWDPNWDPNWDLLELSCNVFTRREGIPLHDPVTLATLGARYGRDGSYWWILLGWIPLVDPSGKDLAGGILPGWISLVDPTAGSRWDGPMICLHADDRRRKTSAWLARERRYVSDVLKESTSPSGWAWVESHASPVHTCGAR